MVNVHIEVVGSARAISRPVLCVTCQGLLGLLSPDHGSEFPADREGQAKVIATVAEEARTQVKDLLRDRYEAEGRPSPPWSRQKGDTT